MNPTSPPPPALSNPRRKLLARLRSRKLREREGLVLVEGPRAVATALDAGARFRFAVVSDAPAPGLLAALIEARVELAFLDPADLAAAADTETPQGILAVVEEPRAELTALLAPASAPAPAPASATAPAPAPATAPAPTPATDTPAPQPAPAGPGAGVRLLLVLDRIQDPGNAGALVRTAAAFGAAGVVALDGTVDPWNPKAVRASAGESFRLPVVRTAWSDFDVWRREHRIPLLLADASGTDVRHLPPPDPARPLALLVGNEGQGPRAEALAAADQVVALPLAPGVESLNAAMAGSILLWALGPAAVRPVPRADSPSANPRPHPHSHPPAP